MSRIQRFFRFLSRDSLAKSKVYFDTVVPLLVSISSVLVAIAAYDVSRQSNRIAELQLTQSKMEHLPLIHFERQLEFDPKQEVYSHVVLKLSNIGEPLREFTEETVVFFKTEVYSPTHPEPQLAWVPVLGYFNASFSTGARVGTLVTKRNLAMPEGNHARAARLEQDFSKLAKARQASHAFSSLEIYVRVNYKDIYDEAHTEFYRLGPASRDGVKLARAEGEERFRKWKASLHEVMLDFDSATAADLYEKHLASLKDQQGK